MDKLKKRLGLLLIILSCVYLLLRIFGLMDQNFHFGGNAHFIAYAVDGTTDYTLTYEQTLALYGTDIPVIYYNDNTGTSSEVTAHYIATTEDSRFNRPSTWKAINFLSGGSTEQRNYVSNLAGGLVYQVTFPRGFVSSNTTAHANISLDFSVTFDYIAHFRQNIFWSQKNSAGSYAKRSNVIYSSSLGSIPFYPVSGNNIVVTSQNNNTFKTFLFPFPELTDPLDEDKTLSMAAVCADLQSDSLFQITASHCTLNNCGVYDDLLANDDFIFIISCPVITGMPAVTTTVPPTTTRAPYTGDYQVTTAQYTYDLSPLETNQINQINIANENLNYVAGIFDGVNIIIQQLDDIYNRMVQEGQVPVNLVPADPLHTLDSDFRANIVNNLTSYTTARLPEAGGGYQLIHTLYYKFTSGEFEIFAVLGGLSLALLVLDWFLFHGRGG